VEKFSLDNQNIDYKLLYCHLLVCVPEIEIRRRPGWTYCLL